MPTSLPTFDRIGHVQVLPFYSLLDNDGSEFPAVELPVKDDPAILPYSSGRQNLTHPPDALPVI
jgi:hypothetical protein